MEQHSEQSPYSNSPPPSIISSRMTDIASEDGDESTSTNRVPSTNKRKSLITADSASTRPGTSTTARGPWSSPHSRRGPLLASRTGSQSSFARPPSVTRTHVPSITQTFRPMSSQRLQAQRGVRPSTVASQVTTGDEAGEPGTPTRTQVLGAHVVYEEMPPPSRGSEMTEQVTEGRLTSNASPTNDHRGQGSMSESVRPLQGKTSNAGVLSLNLDKSYKSNGQPSPMKSPRSFRSGFLLPSRNNSAQETSHRDTEGREKLGSTGSSPALTPVMTKDEVAKKVYMGHNYQYFAGNTRFWLGGRLQNARDRPVNIATGLFAILPGVLFFVFSASWLWHNISPAIPIVFAYLYYICISSFVHASVTDPGVSFNFMTQIIC